MDAAGNGTPRILVVDDDSAARTLLRRLLSTEGYAVEEVPDGATALERLSSEPPDLLLLDIMMPGQDGLDVLQTLRRTSNVPVILLTAKGDEADRVLGFRFGADDYVVKPFSSAELTARIAAVLRRAGAVHHTSGRLDFDGLRIDLVRREVTVGERRVDLPAREFDVLVFLASSPRQTFSREELLDRVWKSPTDSSSATVTEHIGRLRRRIEDDPERPRWIHTVRGVGYRFEP